MPTAELVGIVEGHGDVLSLPILLRRVAALVEPGLAVRVPTVIRTPRSKLVKAGEVERAVELAARKVGRPGGIVLLIDADSDCPATLGPSLLDRARARRGDVPIVSIAAKHEFENWFVAAAESLRGVRGLQADLKRPVDPESIESAKAWLTMRMPRERPYSETIDQPALTAQFDLESAKTAPSFEKAHRDFVRLLSEVRVP